MASMRRCGRCSLLLIVLILAADPFVSAANRMRDKFVIVLSSPLWITGIKQTDRPYSWGFPEPATSEHFVVVNGGYWLWSKQLSTQVTYEYSLNVLKPFPGKVFTRAILKNPDKSGEAIVYEHHLDLNERTTKITHGPLQKVRVDQKYTLTFEVFTDESRTTLLERVNQQIVSSVDNTDGCVELSKEAKREYFARVQAPGQDNKFVAVEKVHLVCEKLDR